MRILIAEDAPVPADGPGIPEEARERVFECFHRTLGTMEGGCGLGLALVREIAQWHQARVTLDSAETGTGPAGIFFPAPA